MLRDAGVRWIPAASERVGGAADDVVATDAAAWGSPTGCPCTLRNERGIAPCRVRRMLGEIRLERGGRQLVPTPCPRRQVHQHHWARPRAGAPGRGRRLSAPRRAQVDPHRATMPSGTALLGERARVVPVRLLARRFLRDWITAGRELVGACGAGIELVGVRPSAEAGAATTFGYSSPPDRAPSRAAWRADSGDVVVVPARPVANAKELSPRPAVRRRKPVGKLPVW